MTAEIQSDEELECYGPVGIRGSKITEKTRCCTPIWRVSVQFLTIQLDSDAPIGDHIEHSAKLGFLAAVAGDGAVDGV